MVALGDRLALLPLLATFLFYPPFAWLALRYVRSHGVSWPFALVNILFAYLACAATIAVNVFLFLPTDLHVLGIVGVSFLFYLGILTINYCILRNYQGGSAITETLVFLFPIAALILIKYVPEVQGAFHSTLKQINITHLSVLFLGLSYVTFRLIQLAQEVRNETVAMPSLIQYLGFAFFVPTLSTGPINLYSTYHDSVYNPNYAETPLLRSLLRIIVGFTKYIFLSTVLNQLTYAGLLFDGHPHAYLDLIIAIFAYTLYLYCNFSGFCDMVIGVSGLLGIGIIENFNRPFLARNLQEFWARWHISLSNWLRDMMFTPTVKALVRVFGAKRGNDVIAFTICCVFLVIGIWHGVGWNFALFGLSQGIGLATVHYYTVFLKKRLSKKAFVAYRANHWISGLGTVTTFVYFSVCLFLFANSLEDMQRIFKIIV